MEIFLSIYPWLFFYLIIFGETSEVYQIYKTKSTKGLSMTTFLVMLLASIFFGWTYFLGGKHSYPLLVGNSFAVILMSYIMFHIFKDKKIKFKYIYALLIFLMGLAMIILGTINYIQLIQNKDAIFKVQTVPRIILIVMPTIGGLTTALLFIPQLIKVIKTKETKNLNSFLLYFFIIYVTNIVVFWILYGINTNNWSLSSPPILFCAICSFVQIWIAFLKHKYEKRAKLKF